MRFATITIFLSTFMAARAFAAPLVQPHTQRAGGGRASEQAYVPAAAAQVPVTETTTQSVYVPETSVTETAVNNYTVEVPPAPKDNSQQLQALAMERDNLQNQLSGIRSEIQRCSKQKTGWTAATIVGGLGVVGTTAGAIYQGIDWSNKNKELNKKGEDLKATNAEIDKANAPAAAENK